MVAAAIPGCSQCSKDDSVAELRERAGTSELSRAATADTWTSAPPGSKFKIGDGLRTGERSTARVELTNGANLRLTERTTIRFELVPKTSGFRLTVETGSAELDVGSDRTSFETSVGRAVLAGGSTIKLTSANGAMTLSVLVGSAQIEGGDEVRTLGAGDSISIAMGRAQLLPDDAGTAPADAAPELDAAVPVAAMVSLEIKGKRVEVRDPTGTEWRKLAAGAAEVPLGSTLRIPRKSSATIRRGTQAAVVVGRAQVVVGIEGALIDVQSGNVNSIVAEQEPTKVGVPGGQLTVVSRRGGSAARLSVARRSGQASIRVTRGFVDVGSGNQSERLAIGETAKLDKGGKLTIANRAPNASDIAIQAGETAVLHDRRGRTAVRIRFADSCPSEGRVEVSSRRNSFSQKRSVAEGVGSARVWADRGANYYRVLCLADGKPAGKSMSGRLYVRRDAGMARLPKKPAHNRVDADGRRYNILYQNLLPSLTFVWNQPPDATGYRLLIKKGSRVVGEFAGTKPSQTVAAGRLPEGDYSFWFDAKGTTRRSKTSRLSIVFDNAAPTAYVRTPTHGAPWLGGKVRVSGVAIAGWSVAIGGAKVPLDRQHRFDTTVSTPQNEQAIAIRLSHPRRGTHYYLRRRGR